MNRYFKTVLVTDVMAGFWKGRFIERVDFELLENSDFPDESVFCLEVQQGSARVFLAQTSSFFRSQDVSSAFDIEALQGAIERQRSSGNDITLNYQLWLTQTPHPFANIYPEGPVQHVTLTTMMRGTSDSSVRLRLDFETDVPVFNPDSEHEYTNFAFEMHRDGSRYVVATHHDSYYVSDDMSAFFDLPRLSQLLHAQLSSTTEDDSPAYQEFLISEQQEDAYAQ